LKQAISLLNKKINEKWLPSIKKNGILFLVVKTSSENKYFNNKLIVDFNFMLC